MQDWYTSATWTILPGYVTGVEGRSPASAIEVYNCLEGWDSPVEGPRGGIESTGRDDYEELAEDMAVADRALGEYANTGLEGTAPYREYRSNRLEPRV